MTRTRVAPLIRTRSAVWAACIATVALAAAALVPLAPDAETIEALAGPATTTTTTTTVASTTTSAPPATVAPTTTVPPTTLPWSPTAVAYAPTTTTTTTTTTTVPPTTEAPAPTTTGSGSGPGVVVSPTGVVLPVLGAVDGGWRVRTPCGAETVLDAGTHVRSVDVLLDAGHGGGEPGAVGANGITEKALNLDVALRVQHHLEHAGLSVLQTRTTDIRLPLRARGAIAMALEPRIFVSIHHNGGAVVRRSTPGTEVFYDAGNPEAKRAGGILYEEIHRALDAFSAEWVGTFAAGATARLNDAGEDLYGIHRYSPGVPSVITEAAYLSNPSEAKLFERADVLEAEARAIARGIVRWLTTADAGSGYVAEFVDGSSSGTGGGDGCRDPQLR